MLNNAVAIMQPYFFPNLAYYRLVHSTELFVFYNDVNFINRGWINRNQILLQNQAKPFTIALKEASQNKLINEIEVFDKPKNMAQFELSLMHAYRKAPHFKEVMDVIRKVIHQPSTLIADLAEASIREVFHYLQLPLHAICSSGIDCQRDAPDKAERLIAIVKCLGKSTYVNAIGGKALYQKTSFADKGVNLLFLKPQQETYKQFKEPFVPGLSMIDVLMFNEPEAIKSMLQHAEFE